MKLNVFVLILCVNVLIFLSECSEGTVASRDASDAPKNGKKTDKVNPD